METLSLRLKNNKIDWNSQQQVMGVAADGSAAGQLRLMSAQQRAPQPPPQLMEPQKAVTPGPGVMYSPQQASQPRRTLGNITNAGPAGAAGGVPPQGPKSPARVPLTSPAPAPAVPVPPKPQFYTHNPNLRSKYSENRVANKLKFYSGFSEQFYL